MGVIIAAWWEHYCSLWCDIDCCQTYVVLSLAWTCNDVFVRGQQCMRCICLQAFCAPKHIHASKIWTAKVLKHCCCQPDCALKRKSASKAKTFMCVPLLYLTEYSLLSWQYSYNSLAHSSFIYVDILQLHLQQPHIIGWNHPWQLIVSCSSTRSNHPTSVRAWTSFIAGCSIVALHSTR